MKNFIRLMLLICAGTLSLSAQFDRAAVLGTVRDTSGAVIPDAAVSLSNVQTGVTQRGTTDETGSYQFLNASIGEYRIDLPRPRDVAEIRLTPRYLELHTEIWHAMKAEVLKGYAQQQRH